jgi:hypothetical protein
MTFLIKTSARYPVELKRRRGTELIVGKFDVVGYMTITVARREAVDFVGTCYRSGHRVFLESYSFDDLKGAAPARWADSFQRRLRSWRPSPPR